MALTVNHPLLKEARPTVLLADSAAVTTAYVRAPVRGFITELNATSGAAVDATRAITCSIITGGTTTAITGGSISMTTAAAGVVYTAVPTGANYVNEDDVIVFASDGAGSTSCPTQFDAVIAVG
jgi:hypothetical protein